MKRHTGIFFTRLLIIFSCSLVTVTFVAAEADEDGKTDEEGGETYNIFGEKLTLDWKFDSENGDISHENVIINLSEIKVKRILFPIKTRGYWNGFYGYIDCEVTDSNLKGPIEIPGKYEPPFTADDFKDSFKRAADESPIIVIDLSKYFLKFDNGEKYIPFYEFNYIPKKEEDNGNGKVITKGVLNKVEGKYATLVPTETLAGWEEDGFIVDITLEGDFPVEPEEYARGESFALIGECDEPYRFGKTRCELVITALEGIDVKNKESINLLSLLSEDQKGELIDLMLRCEEDKVGLGSWTIRFSRLLTEWKKGIEEEDEKNEELLSLIIYISGKLSDNLNSKESDVIAALKGIGVENEKSRSLLELLSEDQKGELIDLTMRWKEGDVMLRDWIDQFIGLLAEWKRGFEEEDRKNREVVLLIDEVLAKLRDYLEHHGFVDWWIDGQAVEPEYEVTSYFVTGEFEGNTVQIKHTIPGFERGDKFDKDDMIVCLKIAPGDPIYAAGYIVSYTTLFEGEIVSAVNTEFDSTIYFNTNLTRPYLETVMGTEPRVDIIKGESKKRQKLLKYGCVDDKDGQSQAFLVLERQIKAGEKVKITLYDNKDNSIEIPITGIVKDVTGVAFKDERTFSAEIMAENNEGGSNARIKIDYKDYRPWNGVIRRGCVRWYAGLDFANGDESRKDNFKGRGELQVIRLRLNKSATVPVSFGFGIAGAGEYYRDKGTSQWELGAGLATEFKILYGNVKTEENLMRILVKPEIMIKWTWEKGVSEEFNIANRYFADRFWFNPYLPVSISYNFDGFRFNAGGGVGYISGDYLDWLAKWQEGEEYKGAIDTQLLWYLAFGFALDPKVVEGNPFNLDSQSMTAVNLAFEHGRMPPDFKLKESVVSLGFQFAPVIK